MKIIAMGTNRPCHQRLLALGHEVVLLLEPAKILPQDHATYSAVVPLVGTDSPESADAALAGADCVAFFHDAYAERAVSLAAQLGVAHQTDLAIAGRFRAKATTRELTAHTPAGAVRWEQASAGMDIEEIRGLARRVGFPLVVKPLSGEASVGVSTVTCVEELDDSVALALAGDPGAAVLFEERLVGREFSVETVTIDGAHQVVGLTEKFTFEGSVVECGHLIPARLSADERESLKGAAVDVLNCLGLRQGAGHSEFMLTQDGPKLIETHDRMGGDRIGALVELATGIDYAGIVARLGVGLPVAAASYQPTLLRAAAIWYAGGDFSTPGTLRAVHGLEAARAVEGVQTVELLKQAGDPVGPVRGSFDRLALAIAVADSAESALRAARSACDLLTFDYEPEGSPAGGTA